MPAFARRSRSGGVSAGTRPLLPRARRVVFLDVEAGDQPAVAHEERAPILEPSEEVKDPDARLDAVRRLKDEPVADPLDEVEE